MNILILDCLTVGNDLRRKFSRDFIGGGPKLIAGILQQLGIKNLSLEIFRAEDLIKKKSENLQNYDLLLISAMTMDLKTVEIIIKFWRNKFRNKLIIIGGPIASDYYLLNKINADIAVSGEGEKKLISLFNIFQNTDYLIDENNAELLKNIQGIAYRYLNKIIRTESASKLTEIEFNELSNPEYYIETIKNYDNYTSARIYVECVRGCSNYYRMKFQLKNSYKCIEGCNNCSQGNLKERIKCPSNIPPGCGFCSTISSFGSPKSRKIEFIVEEIRGLLDLGAKRIVLGGPDLLDFYRNKNINEKYLTTPNIPPEPNYKALDTLISQIIEFKPVKDESAQIFIENVKASLCTDRALKILSKIPNSIFSIGCETGSEAFSIQLGRPFRSEDTLNVIKKTAKFGIRVHVYFIHSLPGEKVEYLKESIDLINQFFKIGVDKITIYKYQEFPGSPFYLLKNKKELMKREDKELKKFRRKLVRQAINFNRVRKEEMIGKIFKVTLAEINKNNREDVIGYILKGGPKVLIKNMAKEIGTNAMVRVNRVISDKLVEGLIIKL